MALASLLIAALLAPCVTKVVQVADDATASYEAERAPVVQSKPVIGVLTQPRDSDGHGLGGPITYFPASYPRYAEMAGAQTVPVLCDSTEEELDDLFSKINGLLVPGGSQDLRPGNCYYDAMSHIMDRAMDAFDKDGEIFPIHFTCLGWESVAVKVTQNPYILSNFTGALGVSDVLNWKDEAFTAESLKMVPRPILDLANTAPLAFEAHRFGVWLPDFEGTELSDFFTLLSTTADALGKVYVSTVEAKRYPFIALQWHPEKIAFEWRAHGVDHSLEAVQLMQGIANQFVQRARLSTHTYPTADALDSALLLNYQPIHDPHGYFEAVYIFPMRPQQSAPRPHNPLYCATDEILMRQASAAPLQAPSSATAFVVATPLLLLSVCFCVFLV